MRIAKLPFLEKKEDANYYLCLILRNEKVKGVIFEKLGDTIKYINDAEENFPTTIEETETEDFLNTLDKVIGQAESVLPSSIETHKTLFALKDSWVEDNKIKKEYLEKLKKAGDELSLEPIGFLVFSESVINLLHKEEGAPITAILVEVGNKYLTVSLVKAGKIIEVRSSEIHQSPGFTVDTLLKHFEAAEVMPSRIIILDGGEDDLTQEFIGYPWSKSLPFLHLPQIASLPEKSDVKAVLLGAATQMNSNLIFDANAAFAARENLQEPQGETKNPDKEELPQQKEEALHEKSNIEHVGSESSMDFFGFVPGDIAKEKPPIVAVKNDLPNEVLEIKTEELPEEEKMEEEKKDNIGGLGVLTAGAFKRFLRDSTKYLKTVNLSNLPFKINGVKDKKLIGLVAGGILIVLFLFFAFVFQTHARINILVNAKEDSKTLSATLSPTSKTDLENNLLSVQLIPVDESGSTTINTTGKKDVGTKAKGAVTIFNNGTDSVSLASGTTITSSNGQKFTLDSSVNVASASGDVFSGTKPGTANANVTAADIGTDYNLPSGTKFSVGSNSNVAAKNDNAFSGGTKKNVTVVSKDDLAKLEENLPKSLSTKAKNDITGKVDSGKTVLPDFVSIDLNDESFDKKVDDNASQVTLKATVSFNFVAYANSDMANLATKTFNDSSFSLEKSNLSVSAKNIKVDKNKDVTADLNINAKLLPKIDVNSLAKDIAGQSTLKVKNQLNNLTNVSTVDISISPSLPFFTGSLPKNPNNIQINISSN